MLRSNSDFLTSLDLVAHVNSRRWIVPDADGSKTRPVIARLGHFFHLGGDSVLYSRGYDRPIERLRFCFFSNHWRSIVYTDYRDYNSPHVACEISASNGVLRRDRRGPIAADRVVPEPGLPARTQSRNFR